MTTPYDPNAAQRSSAGYGPPSPTGYPADSGPQPVTAPGSYPPADMPGAEPTPVPAQPTPRDTTPAPPAGGAERPAAGFDERGHVKRGRAGTLWAALIAGAIGLILLIIFIAQNSTTVPIHFLGFAGHLAVGLTVLIAAVVGLLLAAIPGTIRIVQLRQALKTNVPKERRGR